MEFEDIFFKLHAQITYANMHYMVYLGITPKDCDIHAKTIVPFHKDFSPSGEQLEHRKLAQQL